MEEIYKDIKDEPRYVREAVHQQLRAMNKQNKLPKRKAARREATAQEKREYAKQFHQAKLDEVKSWYGIHK